MEFEPISFDGFDGRENALTQIKRYIHHKTPIMFYRTNVLIHSQRVLWHFEEAVPDILTTYENNFDIEYTRTLALVHDDCEILIGDAQLYDKEKMGAEELETLAKEEINAIPMIVKMYCNVANGFDYAELLTAAKEKRRLEAQFISFFDKFDGGGEAWHETWAGNYNFLQAAGGKEEQERGYVRRLNDFPIKYPNMNKFFKNFPEYLPKSFDFKSVTEKGKPHTKISLHEDSGYPPYERWKKIIMKHEGIDSLINKLEFD